MPGLDGITMVRRIRESHELRRVPVIFFTGQMSPRARHRGPVRRHVRVSSRRPAPGVLEDKVKRALCAERRSEERSPLDATVRGVAICALASPGSQASCVDAVRAGLIGFAGKYVFAGP